MDYKTWLRLPLTIDSSVTNCEYQIEYKISCRRKFGYAANKVKSLFVYRRSATGKMRAITFSEIVTLPLNNFYVTCSCWVNNSIVLT